jgi:hypothetical protein
MDFSRCFAANIEYAKAQRRCPSALWRFMTACSCCLFIVRTVLGRSAVFRGYFLALFFAAFFNRAIYKQYIQQYDIAQHQNNNQRCDMKYGGARNYLQMRLVYLPNHIELLMRVF